MPGLMWNAAGYFLPAAIAAGLLSCDLGPGIGRALAQVAPREVARPDVRLTAHLRNTLQVDGQVSAIAFSPDGKLLACGVSVGNLVKLGTGRILFWQVDSPDNPAEQIGHPKLVTSVAFADDAKTLVSGGDDGTLSFWDVRSRDRVAISVPRPAPLAAEAPRLLLPNVTQIIASPTGKSVIMFDGGSNLSVWDVETREIRRKLSIEPIRSKNLDFVVKKLFCDGEDRTTIVASFRDPGVTFKSWSLASWEAERAKLNWSIVLERGLCTCVARSKDGRYYACMTNGWDVDPDVLDRWRLDLVDSRGGRVIHSIDGLKGESLDFAPSGRFLAVGTAPTFQGDEVRREAMVVLVDLESKSLVEMLPAPGGAAIPVSSVLFGPDGKSIAVGGANTVKIWDIRDFVK